MRKTSNKQSGFAVVFMVLIVSAVTLSASLLLSERSLGSNETSKTTAAHFAALFAAEACAERALLVVRDDTNYEGTLNYTIGEIECSVTVSDEGGDERLLEATVSNEETIVNIIVTTTALSPQITATWIDAKNFD